MLKLIDFRGKISYLFLCDSNYDIQVIFFDAHGNSMGRGDTTPRPQIHLMYKDHEYAIMTFLSPRCKLPPELTPSEITFLRIASSLIYQLEYPTHNMSGKDSQCQYDQESISNAYPWMADNVSLPDR